MFRRREKKVFPPGTFIPTPARVLAILQLCIAFTLILWIGGQPFMGDLFTYKSKLLLYQHTLGDVALLKKLDPQNAEILKPQFERNADRFSLLPVPQQKKILHEYQQLQEQIAASFFQKMQKAAHLFFIETHSYELVWIFLTIILSILLLKRVEGAAHAIWLLPVLVAFYAYENHYNGKIVEPSPDAALFPSEAVIINDYLKEALSPQIKILHEQLKKGWELYLIQEWAKERPSEEVKPYQLQVENGEYAFNLARLEKLSAQPNWYSNDLRSKKSSLLLFLYLLWNVYFAVKVTSVNRQPSRQNTPLTQRG